MKKRMFSKFTSILQHAVDALAPQLSLQEEFVFHWKAVTSFFIENKGEKVPVEQTNIPGHLEQMLVLLLQEEVEGERGMYGPCLEYLLQHKLLETLYSLSRTDYPPGMKQIVLSFFTRLLSRIKQPLLAHVNVYRAVQRMIKTCGEVKAGPSEIEEIQFLCTVCAKIKADPYLVNFFLEVPKPRPGNTSSSAGPSAGPNPVVEEPTAENKLQQDFHLVNTLLTLSHSEDSRVAVKACEGLILCSSLPDPVAAHCMVNSTSFCRDLTQRLVHTYRKLPTEINPVDLEKVQAKWGLEVVTQREDNQTFVGKRQLVSFLSWLDYCDQLSTIANPIVAEALARNIHQHFLIPHFQPDLLQMCETGGITAMAYMSRCLRTVCSQRLLSELVLFLLGNERKSETKGENSDCLRSRLIDRCNSVSEEVCLVTLQLFDTLLQKDDEHIVHNLVLRNLEQRDYYDHGARRKSSNPAELPKTNVIDTSTDFSTKDIDLDESNADSGLEVTCCSTGSESQNQAESPNEELPENESGCKNSESTDINCDNFEKEDKKDPIDNVNNVSAEKCDSTGHGKVTDDVKGKDNVKEDSPFSTPLHVKTEVHKVVNSFLTLLPEQLKSSYQTADSGYDMYLKDAHKQYSAMVECCKSWGYPKDHVLLKTDANRLFYEGSFLHMILDKLSHMLNQSYPINLQLTSVISMLALVPHPCLHEFLLDPQLPLKPGTRNLFSIFQKVSNDIKAQFAAEADLAQKLVRVRRKLMGNVPSMQNVRVSSQGTDNRVDAESRLEAIIVFEEFCKELSAIAFVKHHAAVTEER